MYDEAVAPEGRHVLSMWVYFLPPHVRDGSWSETRQELGEKLIDLVSQYAPNLRDAISDWTLLTPEDIEERIGLTDGNIRPPGHGPAADDVPSTAAWVVELPDACARPVPVRGRDPSRGRGHRGARPQRGPRGPGGPGSGEDPLLISPCEGERRGLLSPSAVRGEAGLAPQVSNSYSLRISVFRFTSSTLSTACCITSD